MRSENNVMKTNMMMEFEGQDMKTWTWKMTGSLERTWMWEDGTPMEWVVKRNGPEIKVDMDFENGAKMRGNIDMNQFSMDIPPKGSDKYNMKFTMTPEAGDGDQGAG